MNTCTIYLTKRVILFAILSAIISCDSLTESDTIIPEKQVSLTANDYYILPGSTIIIDLRSVVEKSFSNVTLKVLENVKRGTLSHIDPFLLKYRPGQDFQTGEDHFVVSAISNGIILSKSTLTIKMRNSIQEFACTLVAIEDRIKLKAGSSSIATAVLENDWLCDIDKSSLNISIHTQPKFGQAIVENDSIIYTRGPQYTSQDELIYQLSSATRDTVYYGLVSIVGLEFSVADRGDITIQTIPGKSFTSLVFIDENTGFLGTNGGIYKTTDGGVNWNVSLADIYCTDIVFLNESIGFALMGSDHIFKTIDGGIKWEIVTRTERITREVLFTSETTGFITVDRESDGADIKEVPILKTEDGGVTWRKVFSDLTVWGYVRIQFINPNVGYAVFSERVFVTTDAGESWSLLLDKSLSFLDVTSENKLFAVPYENPGTIMTREDGDGWSAVADLSYTIGSLGFSPTADVGFASLFTGTAQWYEDPYSLPFSIVKTLDGGETWVEQRFDEALYGFPLEMSVPSNDVAYFLCMDKIIKFSGR